jgi:hypothetical protein
VAAHREAATARAETAAATAAPSTADRRVVGTRSMNHPTAAPPIRPPRCPPMEIPGMTTVSTRLTTISPPTPLCHTFTPRWWRPTAVAPRSPNTAPEAPPVRAWGVSSRAPNDPHRRAAT